MRSAAPPRLPVVRTLSCVALAGCLVGGMAAGAHAQCDTPTPGFVAGAALGLHLRDDDARYLPWLWEMARAGVTHVSLVVAWHQADVESTTLAPGSTTPPDAQVSQTIRDARQLGLGVLVFPIVSVDTRAPGEWRGTLRPTSVNAWFTSYMAFVLHYAAIAEESGADSLAIGSELGSMEQYEIAWRETADMVRGRFGGALLYSANWDHFDAVPFWDAVDRVGVTGYWELAEPGEEVDVDTLVARWTPWRQAVDGLRERTGRRVVITELGYTAQASAAARPWDYTGTEPVDLVSQSRLYEAARLAWCDSQALGGVYLWNWFGAGGTRDAGYTPRNRPALDSVRAWFGPVEAP